MCNNYRYESMMILSQDELFELTGRRRSSSQIAVLNSLGIIHLVRPDGSVVVSKSHIEQILGVSFQSNFSIKTIEPNWGALDAKS